MNCRKVCRWLSAFIDSSLEQSKMAEMEQHLKQCPSCSARAAEMRLIIQTAGELEQLKPGPHFVNRTLCAIENGARPAASLSGWRFALTLSGTAFALAACLTLIMVGPPSASSLAHNKQGEAGKPILIKVNQAQNADDEFAGFPVPEDILKRDLAAADSMNRDSVAGKPTVPMPNLLQRVDFEDPLEVKIESKGK